MERAACIPRILIAGPSGSGKSTLAASVASALAVPRLSLDDVFIRRGKKIFVETATGRVRSFEHPELYDGRMLAQQILTFAAGCVAEGFCLFCYPEIERIEALRFFLDVPFEVCAVRRASRRPSRPSDASFVRIGREMDAAIVRPQVNIHGIRLLDGRKSLPELAAEVCAIARQPTSFPSD